ncbi:hypothetical protein FDUTEX481_00600 [Tolypothrix sp. PCC 7601]|nr:hypothetical protein FDUTEX481_00600 [Tolypothrix sp. PCC 7601]
MTKSIAHDIEKNRPGLCILPIVLIKVNFSFRIYHWPAMVLFCQMNDYNSVIIS